MQVLLFLHRLYFFVILNIRNKKTYKMKKIIFLFIISSLISIKGIGLTLSPETEVSILTCAPGNELYSLFVQGSLWSLQVGCGISKCRLSKLFGQAQWYWSVAATVFCSWDFSIIGLITKDTVQASHG